ncbi:MAG: phage baseplate assembly protein V, partial [Spirulinaceae cyanobacterium]
SNGYVFQNNQTNMVFLRARAARNGFECFVQDGKLNFREPKSDESLELQWLQDFNSFRVRVNSAEQVKEVEVRGWDYSRKKAIVSTKNTDQVITKTEYGKGKSTSTAFQGKPPTPKMVVVDQSVFTAKEADKIAQALCNELGGNFVHADAKGEGNALIRPGKVVKLTEMGKYNGEYYVTETRHLFQDRIYTTEFSVRGLKGRDILDTISPPNHLQPGQAPLIGIVTDNNDPNKWGRVRVKFPTLTEEHSSYWARVLSPGAGGGRGLDCLPEINDEVLVIFENGDIHRPCVLGGVWNGTDATPEGVGDSVADGKVRLRTFQTRTGHKVQFTEEDKGGNKKGITLDTVYGHKIQCNDSEKFIDIKTKSGHEIRMDDQKNTIEIKKGSTSITMQTQAGAITIKGNTITLDAKTITIKGTAAVSVQGGVIKLN